jgi:hypothetical protein
MKKTIIDMCSIDKIARDNKFCDLLINATKNNIIKLLIMDVLEEQYNHDKVPIESKQLLNALSFESIDSEAFIWGYSTWGSKWGDGTQTGLSVSQIMTDKGNHIADSLIAVTSNGNADVFITEDKRLAAKLKKLNIKCQVWNNEELKQFLLQY